MIVLDTNVLSETLRPQPHVGVIAWIRQAPANTTLTSISVGEIFTGIRLLPQGRRREGLTAAAKELLATFGDRVLPYDERAARNYAKMHESRRRAGEPLSVEDGMIAAICRTHGAVLATRNVKDFHRLGVELFDPWEPDTTS